MPGCSAPGWEPPVSGVAPVPPVLTGRSAPVTTTVLPAGIRPDGETEITRPGATSRLCRQRTVTLRPMRRSHVCTAATCRPFS
ncbi:MAG: hypothetical protein JO242_17785, partial [Streptosporangiaceae bacterium]|nr:hypothetical protein [Streptosporangiaceae bacterium]